MYSTRICSISAWDIRSTFHKTRKPTKYSIRSPSARIPHDVFLFFTTVIEHSYVREGSLSPQSEGGFSLGQSYPTYAFREKSQYYSTYSSESTKNNKLTNKTKRNKPSVHQKSLRRQTGECLDTTDSYLRNACGSCNISLTELHKNASCNKWRTYNDAGKVSFSLRSPPKKSLTRRLDR